MNGGDNIKAVFPFNQNIIMKFNFFPNPVLFLGLMIISVIGSLIAVCVYHYGSHFGLILAGVTVMFMVASFTIVVIVFKVFVTYEEWYTKNKLK